MTRATAAGIPLIALLLMSWQRVGTAGSTGLPDIGASRDTVVRVLLEPPPRTGVLQQVLSYTRNGAEDEAVDHRVSAMLRAQDGNLWIVDAQITMQGPTATIRIFRPDGRHLRDVNRRGRGPGEFMGPRGLTQLLDGRIAVADNVERFRITLLKRDGSLDTVWTLTPSHEIATANAGPLLADRYGGLVVQRAGGRSHFLRLSPRGRIIDSLQAPGAPVSAGAVTAVDRIYAPRSVVVPYASSPVGRSMMVLRDGGFVIHPHSEPYRLIVRRPMTTADGTRVREWRAGDPVLVIENRSAAPVPLAPAHRRALVDSVRESQRLAGGRASEGPPPIPEAKRQVRGVTIGQDDRLWVRRHVPSVLCPADEFQAAGWCEPVAEFDVLEPDGRWVGRVRLNERGALLVSTFVGDTVWAARPSVGGVEVIRKYVVRWER